MIINSKNNLKLYEVEGNKLNSSFQSYFPGVNIVILKLQFWFLPGRLCYNYELAWEKKLYWLLTSLIKVLYLLQTTCVTLRPWVSLLILLDVFSQKTLSIWRQSSLSLSFNKAFYDLMILRALRIHY